MSSVLMVEQQDLQDALNDSCILEDTREVLKSLSAVDSDTERKLWLLHNTTAPSLSSATPRVSLSDNVTTDYEDNHSLGFRCYSTPPDDVHRNDSTRSKKGARVDTEQIDIEWDTASRSSKKHAPRTLSRADYAQSQDMEIHLSLPRRSSSNMLVRAKSTTRYTRNESHAKERKSKRSSSKHSYVLDEPSYPLIKTLSRQGDIRSVTAESLSRQPSMARSRSMRSSTQPSRSASRASYGDSLNAPLASATLKPKNSARRTKREPILNVDEKGNPSHNTLLKSAKTPALSRKSSTRHHDSSKSLARSRSIENWKKSNRQFDSSSSETEPLGLSLLKSRNDDHVPLATLVHRSKSLAKSEGRSSKRR